MRRDCDCKVSRYYGTAGDNLRINGEAKNSDFSFKLRDLAKRRSVREISKISVMLLWKLPNAIQLAMDRTRCSVSCRVASRRVAIPVLHLGVISRLRLTLSLHSRSHALRCNRHALIMQMSLEQRAVVNERLACAFGLHRAEKRFSAERDARFVRCTPDAPWSHRVASMAASRQRASYFSCRLHITPRV